MTANSKKRVIVFDRKEMVRHTFSYILTAAGHTLVAVDTSAKVSKALDAQGFDVAILDLGMPARTIKNALKALRGKHPKVRLVGVVDRQAWLSSKNLKILEVANPDVLLLKPFSPEALVNCVESA